MVQVGLYREVEIIENIKNYFYYYKELMQRNTVLEYIKIKFSIMTVFAKKILKESVIYYEYTHI